MQDHSSRSAVIDILWLRVMQSIVALMIPAVEENRNGVCYNNWAMKDAGYVTKIMSTASGLFFLDERMYSHCLEDGCKTSF